MSRFLPLARSFAGSNIMRRHRRSFVVLLAALLAQGSACAQPQTTLAPAKTGVIANLVPVPAPLARAVALSEPLGLLAFVHDKAHLDAHVSLVKLDAKGTPLAYAVPWKIPHVKGLEKHPNYALSVAFHPKLPLLYVWQDLNLNYTNPPGPAPAELKQFDRLLVYRVAKEPPELLLSLCRGIPTKN